MQRDVSSHCDLPTTAYAIAGQQDKEGAVPRGAAKTGETKLFYRRERKDQTNAENLLDRIYGMNGIGGGRSVH
jgi:poly(3-hydroxybutyrate) depolymerase